MSSAPHGSVFHIAAGVLLLVLAEMVLAQANPLWLHPACEPVATMIQGPFVKLADGGVLGVLQDKAMVSRDGGKTWHAYPMFHADQKLKVSSERALLRTKNGTILIVFMNVEGRKWGWDEKANAPIEGVRMDTYVARSTDDGETWTATILQPNYWCGDVRDMIQMNSGRIVVSVQRLLPEFARHAVVTYSSDDDGLTWRPSNALDLGGRGHHDGAIEATVEQLRDGRLWLLIRTNLDQFWEAFSDDGRYWRTLRPSGIPASSAPGLLKRLESGRLILIWTRLYPEGKDHWPRTGSNSSFAEPATSVFREELSVAFSEDDGKTWSKPLVIARQPKASLAYPHVLEYEPGVLWITTMQGGLRLRVQEVDLLAETRRASPEGQPAPGQTPP